MVTKKEKEVLCTDIAVIKNDISYIKDEILEIKGLVTDHYVTKEEFDPIKRLVYGVTGLVLTGVILVLLSLVFQK